ncbi:hypothetical protein BGZ47_001215 [Haplosporangium gracile]|nr:hypothetical protein BGZ47_001215 [Haplosporangium gracile]
MTRYHDPRPVFIPNPIAGRPPLKVQRDPTRGMYYPCPHPKCNHTSILKADPRQHQMVCKYRDRTRFNRPIEAQILTHKKRPKRQLFGRRQQQQQQQQQRRRRAVPRFPVYRHSSVQPSSSTPIYRPSVAAAAAASDSRHMSRTHANISFTVLDEILATMINLTNSISGLAKELDQQTVGIDTMGEQMDWLTDQIDQIRSKNAGLETHTESLRIDAGLVEDHLRDLIQDNRKVKEQFRDVLEDVGRMRAMTKGLWQHNAFHLE